jgi:hypothetical protein
MPYQPDFDLDLKTGEQGEALVKAGLTGTVEVKTDRRVSETGNLYIELWQFSEADRANKRPSGLSTTKAEFWATTTVKGTGFLIVKTDQLKALIKANRYTQTSQPIANSKTNGSVGVLVPLKDLLTEVGF